MHTSLDSSSSQGIEGDSSRRLVMTQWQTRGYDTVGYDSPEVMTQWKTRGYDTVIPAVGYDSPDLVVDDSLFLGDWLLHQTVLICPEQSEFCAWTVHILGAW